MTALMLAAMLSLAAEAPKVQKIEFDPDLVEGTLKGPDLGEITADKRPIFKPLIKVRENWNDKIVKSVDQL